MLDIKIPEILMKDMYKKLAIIMTLFFIGFYFNYSAIITNECRMPILTEEKVDTIRHFSYTDTKGINKFLFTDIFNIGFLYFSIGDILIWIGLGYLIYCLIDNGIKYWKYRLDKLNRLEELQ